MKSLVEADLLTIYVSEPKPMISRTSSRALESEARHEGEIEGAARTATDASAHEGCSGMKVRDEIPALSQPEPPHGRRAITAGELERYIDRGRRLRAEFIARLFRRGVGGLMRLLRRAARAPLRRRLIRRTGGRRLLVRSCFVVAQPDRQVAPPARGGALDNGVGPVL
jgi:hypothetical protein